jgi:hypothetical protein
MWLKERKKHIALFMLTGILLFHFTNNFLWSSQDGVIEGIDCHWHVMETVKSHIALKKIFLSNLSFFEKSYQAVYIFSSWQTANWPPLFYFSSFLLNPCFVNKFCLRVYLNFIFFSLLIISTYFLGKKCFNKSVGLIAAFIISFYPAVYSLSRQFGLDFPLLCMTATCLCFLIYSEHFTNKKYSLLFGVSLGMATLIKLQVIFFILPPLLFEMWRIFHRKENVQFSTASNVILSFIITACLFSLYWGRKLIFTFVNFYDHCFFNYAFHLNKSQTPVRGTVLPVVSLANIRFYIESMVYHSSFYLFLLFVYSLVIFLVAKKNHWKSFYFFSLSCSYLIITVIACKWTRFALPILIFMAIISGFSLDQIKNKCLKGVILGSVILYCVYACVFNSWFNTHYCPVPRYFFKPMMKDAVFTFIRPPNKFSYINELERQGVIRNIEEKLCKEKVVMIAYGGVYINAFIEDLYLYFQESIFNNKIQIGRREHYGFENPDYIALDYSDFIADRQCWEKYRLLANIKGKVFLVKNEE